VKKAPKVPIHYEDEEE